MINILIADDHELFIDGIKAVLRNEPNFNIIQPALNGKEVMQVLNKIHVDILLLDINMPSTDINDLIKEIKSKYKGTKIIILTGSYGTRYYTKLSKYGVEGFLFKRGNKAELIDAINIVFNGGVYVSNEVLLEVSCGKANLLPSVNTNQVSLEDILTKREIEILELIVIQELSNHEIAEKLFISTGTVDTHRKNMILKLGVRNTIGLVKYVCKNHLFDK